MPIPNSLTLPMLEQMMLDLDLLDTPAPAPMRSATEISALMRQSVLNQKFLVSKLEKMMFDADYPFETKMHPDWRPKRPGGRAVNTVHIGCPPTFSLRPSALKPSTKR